MLNIMVVDDEAPIRDWLVYCIQKCPSATQVTSAVNGDEAYRMILETKPNVVFTDIRMPLMDGLELMSKVREILPFTVFIILTNYAEFSYAKEAISLGAREYILKSEMRSADIQRIVEEIAANTAKIKAEKVQDTLRDGVVDLYEMYHNFEQPGAVAAFWQRQGLQNHQPYLAFCVANDNSVGLRRQIAELAGASRVALSLAAMEQDYLYLILQCHDSEALRQCMLSVESSLGECGLPAGVSAIRTDTDQFIKVLGEAAAARDACFFTGGGVVPYGAIRSLPPIDWEDVLTRKQEIIHLLSHRQPEEALEALKNWFSLFRMVGADDIRKAIDHINRMVISMEDWYYQFSSPPPAGWTPPQSFSACRSRCVSMLEEVLREQRSRHSLPIETALSYIHSHYAQPISMAEVAGQLYRSPEHFSRQFKEEVGENFSAYLTRYRLDRAQDLLQTTDLPIALVAAQTGYTTPGYFSRLYKKYKGISPEQERRRSKM